MNNNSLNQQNYELENKLNNEILKNNKLQKEIQNLNNIIQNYINQINYLNSELQKYKNENEKLKSMTNQMGINQNNISDLQKEIGALNYKLNLKDNEINKLKSQIPNKYVNLNDIIVINFISTDAKIHEGIKCLSDETFAEVEERLYQKYDEYRNTNNTFLFKGNQILRFKKIKENKIMDRDIIQLVTFDN